MESPSSRDESSQLDRRQLPTRREWWLPRSLTARLVLTAVALVALVSTLVAVSTTLAMRAYLTDQLDDDVRGALGRAVADPRGGLPDRLGDRPFGQGPGTLIALSQGDAATALVIGERHGDVRQFQLRDFQGVPADGEAHSMDIGHHSYRAMALRDDAGRSLTVGLPTDDIDRQVVQLITLFALLTIAGVGLAGGVGTWLVRRQLRPLHAVAETARTVSGQRLDRGDTTIDSRVPGELTDPETEVGQVGAALNTLLDHVEDALSARHRSEQQVRQFVADASHELRTPLSTIHGYAELSRRTPDDAAALLSALGKVETEAGRMSGLVEDLLLLARLDSGRPLEQEEVDVTRLLLEAVTDARVVAPEQTWRLELPDEPVTVTGDAARLHQVVTNLLNNARTHTPAGTTITVRATPGPVVRLEVHDDGPGLAPGLVEHAFERFTRGDSSRTRSSGGAGLGLSLVAAIAQAHGGQATVRSQPGDTTFTVVLPG